MLSIWSRPKFCCMGKSQATFKLSSTNALVFVMLCDKKLPSNPDHVEDDFRKQIWEKRENAGDQYFPFLQRCFRQK